VLGPNGAENVWPKQRQKECMIIKWRVLRESAINILCEFVDAVK
jgi:hypothetical protein